MRSNSTLRRWPATSALLETTPGSVLVVEAMAASYRQIFLALAASTGLSFLFLIRMEELPLRGRRPD